jgi:hypothetical protein
LELNTEGSLTSDCIWADTNISKASRVQFLSLSFFM